MVIRAYAKQAETIAKSQNWPGEDTNTALSKERHGSPQPIPLTAIVLDSGCCH